MKYSLRLFMLILLLSSLVIAFGTRYHRHWTLWSLYSSNSLQKSDWESKGWVYRNSAKNGFQCLELLDPNFVDFRCSGNSDRWVTAWRIPHSTSALNEHLKFLELDPEPRSPTNDILENMKNEFPEDWEVAITGELQFFLRRNCDDFSYFCRFLMVDPIHGIIYFFDLDHSIPA